MRNGPFKIYVVSTILAFRITGIVLGSQGPLLQSFYTKEEEYDLVYITVILLAVLLDSGTAGAPSPSSLRSGRWRS